MRRFMIFVFVLIFATGRFGHGDGFAQTGETKSGDSSKTIEGELHSAASLFADAEGAQRAALDRAALTKGLPGGILAEKKFILLLVDGRVLGNLHAVLPEDANAVRVQGIMHDEGRSLTPRRIEYKSAGRWRTFDLPLSGTLAGEVYGGEAGLERPKPPDNGVNPQSAENAAREQVEGTLTEARCYFTTGEVGGKHTYCAFMSMRANLPVGILTDKKEFIYLDIDSKALTMHATKTIRAEGKVASGGRVLKPEKLSVKNGSEWEEIRQQKDQ